MRPLMGEGIVDLAREAPPGRLTAEVCIIGSGCAGATAARRLAEAGHEVVVLEEGGDFTGKQLTQRGTAMYDQLYMDRGGRTTEDASVSILQGRVLGGGGVINACDVVPPPESVLEFWGRKYGLTGFSAAALRPNIQRALDDLGAHPGRRAELNEANMLLERGAQALGYRGEAMMHNRRECIGLGTCLLGCPANAKQNPRFVAIPAAVRAGARFYTRARAVRVRHTTGELKLIEARTLDAKGYHEREPFEIQAKVLILAANAVGSTHLLLRSGIGNEHIGQHLSLQPQLPVTALFDHVVDAFSGIPQAYAVTHFEEEDNPEHGLWGFRIEAIFGTPDITASLLPYSGLEAKEVMTRFPHMASALLLAPDDPTGQVGIHQSGRPLVRYRHDENHRSRLRQAIKAAARVYLAAGARQVDVPVMPPLRIASEKDLEQVDRLAFEPATAPLLSAHQQGGVRFAPTPAHGGANPEGQVYGTRDVYVFDSAGFPSSASSHTMTPIIAIAHHLSDGLIARLG
ncbi:MAG: GMC family oxidoreductase [Candidatus Hydrogenedentes bacterium]|nr:GMC family oxidoreductase [Candidatus Hydrogenedentota bacterium]